MEVTEHKRGLVAELRRALACLPRGLHRWKALQSAARADGPLSVLVAERTASLPAMLSTSKVTGYFRNVSLACQYGLWGEASCRWFSEVIGFHDACGSGRRAAWTSSFNAGQAFLWRGSSVKSRAVGASPSGWGRMSEAKGARGYGT